MPPRTKRGKNKDNARRSKKKVSILTQERIEYVDWKDVNLLRRFVSDRAKVRARRVTGNSAQQQREIALAIKNAREMALLPYSTRITTQRGGRGRRDERRDDAPPRPTTPPPRPGEADADGAGPGEEAMVGIEDMDATPGMDGADAEDSEELAGAEIPE